MSTSTVGTDKDYATLALWEDAKDATLTEDHTAVCYGGSDLGGALFTALNSGYKWIIQAATGESPYISTPPAGSNVAIRITSSDISDLTINGGTGGAGVSVWFGVYSENSADVTITVKRCIGNTVQLCRCVPYNTYTHTITWENCKCTSNGGTYTSCFHADIGSGGTLVESFLSCTADGKGTAANVFDMRINQPGSVSITLRNCIGVGATTADFRAYTSHGAYYDDEYCMDTTGHLASNTAFQGFGHITSVTETDIFTDYANEDYTLKRGCKARCAGDPQNLQTEDINGTTRPTKQIADMGCYESAKPTPEESTVGTGKDYSTLALWEDACDNDTTKSYQANCYGGSDLGGVSYTGLSPGEEWRIVAAEGEEPYIDTPYASGATAFRFWQRTTDEVQGNVYISGFRQTASFTGDYFSWCNNYARMSMTIEDCDVGAANFTHICPDATSEDVAQRCYVRNCLSTGGPSSYGFAYCSISNGARIYYYMYHCTGVAVASIANGVTLYSVTGGEVRNCVFVNCTSHDWISSGNDAVDSFMDYVTTSTGTIGNYINPVPSNCIQNATEADLFKDYSGGDYTPAKGSDIHCNGEAGHATTDLNGASRPVGSAPDRGCYERRSERKKLMFNLISPLISGV